MNVHYPSNSNNIYPLEVQKLHIFFSRGSNHFEQQPKQSFCLLLCWKLIEFASFVFNGAFSWFIGSTCSKVTKNWSPFFFALCKYLYLSTGFPFEKWLSPSTFWKIKSTCRLHMYRIFHITYLFCSSPDVDFIKSGG